MTVREQLVAIFQAAIDAVSPHGALLRNLRISGDRLVAGGKEFAPKRIFVAGAGKGAAPMARALEELPGLRVEKGFVAVKYGHDLPLHSLELAEAAHPEPDAASELAGRRCLEIARACGEDDLLIVLLTGGASALLSTPAPGLTLEDLRAATAELLACGADIAELNTIRKHLSAISGGRLAEAAFPANVLGIIVSDVIGDDLSVIASGPTAPDSSTFADCLQIISKYGLEDKLPSPVLAHLRDGAAGKRPETAKSDAPCFARTTNIIVAGNRQALEAAAEKARSLGLETVILDAHMRGEARLMAASLIARAREMADRTSRPFCLLAGGETTVTIRGEGKGGRNQEMALAASLELVDEPRISALFAGTDGTDGPTDAAGGFARAGIEVDDARHSLDSNDSYNALKRSGDLFVTGPTLTNVMDIAIIMAEPPAA